ncbi:MAG TPA: NapC/NirT family cytochrome c [Accumulibacter sp.]|jgi:cytochrome c-type protein NapC|nr:NapC/NirT family cytochrome c [Accumulibacter sp.]
MAGNEKSGLWEVLRRPSAKYSLLGILAVGMLCGAFFWSGFNGALEATNSLEFCIGCHEMRDTVYREYRQTIHYANRTGVRAVCADCHVPKDWSRRLIRKITAAKDVWGTLTGVIDTPEKFEAHRLRMAENEWARMKASDSRECRDCHVAEGMDVEKQKLRASKMHKIGVADRQTCIDCHKGIAHKKPQGMTQDDDD